MILTPERKLVLQTLAASYECILESGEHEIIQDLKILGKDIGIYPHILERAKQLGVDISKSEK